MNFSQWLHFWLPLQFTELSCSCFLRIFAADKFTVAIVVDLNNSFCCCFSSIFESAVDQNEILVVVYVSFLAVDYFVVAMCQFAVDQNEIVVVVYVSFLAVDYFVVAMVELVADLNEIVVVMRLKIVSPYS